jgi:hypothetical protein
LKDEFRVHICRTETQELSQPEGGEWWVYPKTENFEGEIKVTLELEGDRSDRS